MKYVKYSLRPLAMFLSFAMVAMVGTRDFLFAAAEETKKNKGASSDPAVLPEVLVSGQTNKKSRYKSDKMSSGKYTAPLRDIPQTIQVIPQAVMQEQGATTLRETLRNVPGISMQAGEGGVPAGDQMTIRGFNARTDMYVDNFRDFGGYTRDAFNLEQVEVVKGPSSSYGGRGSTGASVNQVSKAPSLDPFYKASAGFGSSFYKRTTVDVNQPLGEKFPLEGTAFRLNGVFHDADVSGRDEVTNKRWGIAPSLAFGLDTPLRTTLSYFYLGQDNLPDYGIPWVPTANATGSLAGYAEKPAPTDWHNFYGLTDRDYEKTATHIFSAKVEYDVSDALSLRDQFRYGVATRDSIITAPRFASTGNQQINRQVQSRDMKDTILANQTDATLKFDTGSIEHTLVTGVEFNHETSDNRPRTGLATPTADLYNPQSGQSMAGVISISPMQNSADSNGAALYAFDTIKLLEQLEVNGGLRWDYFNTNFQAATGGDALERTDKVFSWKGGVVYKPVEIGSIYFGYGTSFNPSAEGLSLGNTATATNSIRLDPETTRSFEIGTKWDLFAERLALTAALFRIDKTNSRTEDPTNPNDVLVLEGNQRVLGMEYGINGNVTKDWAVFAGYTILDSEITKSKVAGDLGKELGNTPRHSLNFWTTYQLPFNLTVGGGAQYVGDRFNDTRLNNVANIRKAPGYTLFDAMLAYKLNENITFRVNAYNLTDQEYIGSVGGGHFIPGTGRSVVAATEFQF